MFRQYHRSRSYVFGSFYTFGVKKPVSDSKGLGLGWPGLSLCKFGLDLGPGWAGLSLGVRHTGLDYITAVQSSLQYVHKKMLPIFKKFLK